MDDYQFEGICILMFLVHFSVIKTMSQVFWCQKNKLNILTVFFILTKRTANKVYTFKNYYILGNNTCIIILIISIFHFLIISKIILDFYLKD